MSDPTAVKEDEIDYLNMSDEELLAAKPPGAVASADADDTDDDLPEPTEEVAEEAAEDKAVENKEDAEDADDEAGDSPAEKEADEGKAAEKPAAEVNTEVKEEVADAAAPNYEAEYKKLLAPFKANGRDIQVKSVDEAVTLMQMGANYNKKMAALKPNLKLMKLLENNGFLSEDKISFLIDLGNKNPQAINKLVKDSGIDPMDFDAEKASAYKQTAYTVDDREIELDTVLDDLQTTPTYNRTLEIVSNKWDAASKQVVAGNPQLLRVINDHVANGIYDRITKELESERMFGRLSGMSDIEAYRQVGDQLHAKGAFNSMLQGSSQDTQQQAPANVVVQPKPKQVDDDKLKDKKRAASSTKPAGLASKVAADFDPLALSDEEFSKLVNKRFL